MSELPFTIPDLTEGAPSYPVWNVPEALQGDVNVSTTTSTIGRLDYSVPGPSVTPWSDYGAGGEYGVGQDVSGPPNPAMSGGVPSWLQPAETSRFPAPAADAKAPYDPTKPETWEWYGFTNPYPPGTTFDPKTRTATTPGGASVGSPTAIGQMLGGTGKSALSQILDALGVWIGRGAVIALGLVLITIAVWALVKDTPSGRAVKAFALRRIGL